MLVESVINNRITHKFIPQIISLVKNTQILMVVQEGEIDIGLQGISAGAVGFIYKTNSSENVLEIIYDVYTNGSMMSREINKAIIKVLERENVLNTRLPLSHREKQIKVLHTQGLSYKEIAEKLFISPLTARTHLRNIKLKLKNYYNQTIT